MEKPWLPHYPQGVPEEISTSGYESLSDLFTEACARHADRRALVFMGRSITYKELGSVSTAVAAWIQAQELPAGSRVALMMPNVLAYVPALLAALQAGMVAVNINPMYTAAELEAQLRDSRPDLIFIFESFAATLGQVPADLRPSKIVLVSAGDLMGLKGKVIDFAARHVKRMVPTHAFSDAFKLDAVVKQGRSLSFKKPSLNLTHTAVLQYTGGTTGTPKGAELSHGNLVANVLQVQAVARPALGESGGAGMVILTALPLYHIFAMTVCGLFALHAGMCSVLVADPRKLDTLVAAWRRDPVGIFPAVNTLFNALVHNEAFQQLDFSSLRLCFGGGAAVQRAVAEKWKEVTGRPIIEGYGLTETSPVAIVNPTNAIEYSGDIGLPVPSTEVMILDGNEQPVGLGEAGEVAIRGPQVMKGYWGRPDDTRAAFTADGFFKTGDIGIMSPDGRVRIIDRKKDMILVSGFNVYPNEVEQVVASHPGVLECVVVGVPDPRSGEAVKLYVVRKDPSLTVEELRHWCAERLTPYKRPHQIEFRAELPKSNTGKILRRVLRDEPSQKA